MGHTLQRVFNLSEAQPAIIRRQAYARVVQRYDFQRNFPATLRWFWGTNPLRIPPAENP